MDAERINAVEYALDDLDQRGRRAAEVSLTTLPSAAGWTR